MQRPYVAFKCGESCVRTRSTGAERCRYVWHDQLTLDRTCGDHLLQCVIRDSTAPGKGDVIAVGSLNLQDLDSFSGRIEVKP